MQIGGGMEKLRSMLGGKLAQKQEQKVVKMGNCNEKTEDGMEEQGERKGCWS